MSVPCIMLVLKGRPADKTSCSYVTSIVVTSIVLMECCCCKIDSGLPGASRRSRAASRAETLSRFGED